MSQSPFISVIVRVYNVEQRYSKICINSISAQTFQDFEVVVMTGDFSNNFFDKVHGKYIYFVDGDAVLLPNSLEKIFNALQIDEEIDAVHLQGWYETFQTDNAPIELKNLRLSWEERTAEGFLTENIPRRLAENWLNNPAANFFGSTVLKREIFEENIFKTQPPPPRRVRSRRKNFYTRDNVLCEKIFVYSRFNLY